MSNFFQAVHKDIDIKRKNSLIDVIQYTNSSNPEIYILLEEKLNEKILKKFIELIFKEIGQSSSITILSVLPFIPTQKDLAKTVVDFYIKSSIDLLKYIKPFSKIITVGRALYSITKSDALNTKTFYDIIFNKQYFYAPELRSYIFPIDSIPIWFGQDKFERFFALDQIKHAYNFEVKPLRIAKLNLEYIQSPNNFLEQNMNKDKFSLDLETVGLDYLTGSIGCVTLSFDGKTGYYLDWDKINIDLFNQFLRNKYIIGANAKYDLKFLIHNGIKRKNVTIGFDTMNAGHLLNEMRSNSLKTHAWLYTNYGGYDEELNNYKKRYPNVKRNYMKIPFDIRFPYATMDAIITFQVFQEMKKQLKKIDRFFPMKNDWSLSKYYNNIVLPTINMYIDIEMQGVYINKQKLSEISSYIKKLIEEVRQEIYLNIGTSTLDLDSGKELGLYLEYQLKWPMIERTKVKENFFLSNEKCLKKWEKMGYKGATLLLKYRELNTLYKTFIGGEKENTGMWQYIYKNKVYPKYGVMMTNSHRNKCSDPNFQNFPQHGEYAKLLRSFFDLPTKDFVFGVIDFKGLQLRLACIASGDEKMKNAFTSKDGDLHSVTGNSIFMRNVSLEEFLRRKTEKKFADARYKGKQANFSLIFGSSGFSFAKEALEPEWTDTECEEYIIHNKLINNPKRLLELSQKENKKVDLQFCKYWAVANHIRKLFLETYKGLQDWHEKTIKFAHENGYVRSPFGAIRRLPELLYRGDQTQNQRNKNLHNISLNSPIQNMEIALISLSMVELSKKIQELKLKSYIFGMVHDSVELYIHRTEINIIKKLCYEIFEQQRKEYKEVPILIDGEISDLEKNEVLGFGSYWGDYE